jgi:RNA polymerase sigma-70 factor, ECF subfamily
VVEFQSTLRAAQQGSDEAFARMWRHYQPGLIRYLSMKAGPDAEDLAADIWLNIARALPGFEGDEHGFRSWIFTTARNRLTDWYRGSGRRPEVSEPGSFLAIPSDGSVEGEVVERSATDAAVALIGTLPPDQSEAVMLRIVVGLDVAHVARIMERSPGAVRVLCHRGLRHLERRFADGGPEAWECAVRRRAPHTGPTPWAAGTARRPAGRGRLHG